MSSGMPVRIAMVAGDAAGDALGAHLVEALSEALPGAHFLGIGGPKMQAAGFETWYPADRLAARGSREPLRRRPEILRLRRELLRRLLAAPPELFVGVDAADFNLGVEERLRAQGIRTVHYVAPPVPMASKQRLHRLARAADRVLALFPYEVPVLEQAGVAVTYVGHPLADQVPEVPDRQAAREQFRLSSAHTVVALLPGNEVSEVEFMGELFIRAARLIHRQVRNVHFLAPLSSRPTRSSFEETLYRLEAQDLPLTILFGHALLAMTAADSVLLAAGPGCLEAALLKRPMVVAQRFAPAAYMQAERRGEALPCLAPPNLLAGRFVVPELLQDDATAENLAQAVVNQLADKVVRQRQERVFLELHRLLRQNAGKRLVETLVPLLTRADRRGPLAASAPAGA